MKALRFIIFFLACVSVSIGIAVLAIVVSDAESEEFQRECKNEGGRYIEVGTEAMCRLGKVVIEQ